MTPDLLAGLAVAPVVLVPVAFGARQVVRVLRPTVLRWHRAFSWPERIGIALLMVNGLGHLYLVLR